MINRLVINNKVLKDFYTGQDHTYKTGEVDVVTAEVVGNSRKVFKRIEKRGVEDTLSIFYRNTKNKTYEEVIDDVVDKLKIGEREELRIGYTDTEYYSLGYFTGVLEIETNERVKPYYELDLEVTYIEPYKYSNKLEEVELEEGKFDVSNSKSEVEPVIKLTANESARFVNITNDNTNETLVVGEDSDGDERVDELTVFKMNGLNGLTDKGSAGNTINYEDGLLKPVFDTNGGNVVFEHNLSKNLNDFTQQITFRTKGIETRQKSTSYMYMYDNDGNIVVSLEMVVDPNASNNELRGKAHIVFKVLNRAGTGLVKLLEYSGRWNRRVFDDTDLTVRIGRTGRDYYLKTWKYSKTDGSITGRHNQRWEGFGERQISKFNVGFKKDKNRPYPNIGIGNIEVNELINGNSPYYNLVNEGDELVIDSYKRLVTRNGEPISELKDHFTEYVSIGKGRNNIEVHPLGVYDGTIEYRERKL